MAHTDRQRLKLVLFWLAPAAVVAAVLTGAWLWWRATEDSVARDQRLNQAWLLLQASGDAVARGQRLNRDAWESSYTERGQPVPPAGPREGYWGARLGSKVRDPRLGWHESAVVVPGLLDIDERGLQRYRAAAGQKRHVLILGGSVAFGAYASSIDTTYFHVIGADLERGGTPADVTVVSSGAWKSIQELRALEVYGATLRPDVVVFLNGLNDLTNGANSRTLYGDRVPTLDGTAWTMTYHEHDYDQRVSDYLENMRRAAGLAASLASDTLVILQPALVERERPTELEDLLLTGSLLPHASAEALTRSHQAMRAGLAAHERAGLLQFLDCSRAFDGERATTFADMWHFSDFGHAILGQRMAARIALMLSRRTAGADPSPTGGEPAGE